MYECVNGSVLSLTGVTVLCPWEIHENQYVTRFELSKLRELTKILTKKFSGKNEIYLYLYGWEADDICIFKVIKYFSFTTLTFLKFLFFEWFVAFCSFIYIYKLMIDGVVIYLYWNNGLPPWEYGAWVCVVDVQKNRLDSFGHSKHMV